MSSEMFDQELPTRIEVPGAGCGIPAGLGAFRSAHEAVQAERALPAPDTGG